MVEEEDNDVTEEEEIREINRALSGNACDSDSCSDNEEMIHEMCKDLYHAKLTIIDVVDLFPKFYKQITNFCYSS